MTAPLVIATDGGRGEGVPDRRKDDTERIPGGHNWISPPILSPVDSPGLPRYDRLHFLSCDDSKVSGHRSLQ